MAQLIVESVEAFRRAAATHGEDIFGDIPNVTDAQAQVQINDVA